MQTYQELRQAIDMLRRELESIAPKKNETRRNVEKMREEQNAVNEEYKEEIARIEKLRTNALSESQEKIYAENAKFHQLTHEAATINENIEKLTADLATILQKQELADSMKLVEAMITEMARETEWYTKAASFQHEDISFTVNAYKNELSGVLNANQMGLGKTMETVASDFVLRLLFEQEHGRKPRCLWLTKKSLMESNIREIRKWDPSRFGLMVKGDQKTREFAVELALQTDSLCVANYEAVRTTPLIRKIEWDFIYIDEVHKLKGGANANGPTQVWKDVKALTQKCKFVIMLSGTPIGNHPNEMWSYLHIFEPQRFPTLRRFEREFTSGWGEEGYVVDFTKLITVLKNQCFRRTKKEVGIQLPDKTREFRYVEMTNGQADMYNQMRDNFFLWLDSEKSNALSAAAIIAQLTRLRQIASFPGSIKMKDDKGNEHAMECQESAKIDEAMNIIEELLNEDEQVVVFSSQFNGPLDEVRRRVSLLEGSPSVEVLKGDNSFDVGNIEKRFQNGETKVLCVNMKTGSEGLNLQKNPGTWVGGASHAVFIDLWYSPSVNEQAEDRLHRIGANENVTIHILQAENSVDAFIAATLEKKSNMMEGIIEAEDLRSPADWKDYLSDKI